MKTAIFELRLEKMEVRETPAVNGSYDIVSVLKNIGLHERAEEYFMLLCLNTKGFIIGTHEVSHGHLSGSIVHPREVFKRALLNNAAAIIVAHNHPSGDTTPSQEDIGVTKRLKDCGDLLGVKLLDHIIVSPSGNYTSLADDGLLGG